MEIEIKRNTEDGLIPMKGELYELHGYQFCIGYIDEMGCFIAIELSTGANAVDDVYKAGSVDRCIAILNTRDKETYDKSILSFRKTFHISDVINKPIEK